MAAAPSEEQYFAKLSQLVLNEGTAALRMALDSVHPPDNLQASLQHHRTTLEGLRKRPRVLNPTQWELLFPNDGKAADSANFDITLLYVLLRNICSLKEPKSGWNSLPPPSDKSREASMAVIKHFRNTFFAHATRYGISEMEFHTHWDRLSDAVVNLGVDKDRVARLKEETLTKSQIEEVKERICSMGKKLDMVAENQDKQAMQIDGLRDSVDTVAAKVDVIATALSSKSESLAASSSQPQASTSRQSGKRKRKGKPLQDINGSGLLDPEKQYPLPRHPNPDLGCFELGMIKYMHPNIKKCYGCKRIVRFKRNPPPPSPYGDLLLATRGNRIYRKSPDGTEIKVLGNMYFHVNKYCVASYCPQFSPCTVHVEEDLKPLLQPEHRSFLQKFGINLTP